MTSYELFRSEEGADPYYYITLSVTINGISLFDHSFGESCRSVTGTDEIEYYTGVSTEGAEKILRHLGQEPGPYPAQKLALYLAETLHGRPDATERFRELAKAAGVNISGFVR